MIARLEIEGSAPLPLRRTGKMISIFRDHISTNCPLNVFNERHSVRRDEVRIVENAHGVQGNTVAMPAEKGRYAFGGTFLYTSNGAFPEFNKRPVPLHDRNMDLEVGDQGI